MTPLLARTTSADRQFERIYQRHVADVYRYSLALLRNPHDAEDVTQTTFMNAYRSMQNGERPDSPKNWLIAIAHNVCRQRFRQAQRRPQESELYEESIVEEPAETAHTAQDIQRGLGQLAFNQRAALVMRELEGRSYTEIAEVMGLSVSAVETVIFRARRALREQLEGSLSCSEAERFLSKQLDGELPRAERGPLRAHLRQCKECEQLARSQRASRGALKALLGGLPVPASFLGGGSGLTLGIAAKAAAVVCAGAVVGTGGYEAAKKIEAPPAASKSAVAKSAASGRVVSPRSGAKDNAVARGPHGVGVGVGAAVLHQPTTLRHAKQPFFPAAATIAKQHGRAVGHTTVHTTAVHTTAVHPTAVHTTPVHTAMPVRTKVVRPLKPNSSATARAKSRKAKAAANAHVERGVGGQQRTQTDPADVTTTTQTVAPAVDPLDSAGNSGNSPGK